MTKDYKRNDPKGWCGDPKRGAAMGRRNILDAPTDQPIKLYLLPIRFVDGDYDVNGTYWGGGEPLYWFADDEGEVDAVLRASDRGAAIETIRKLHYLHATFYNDRHFAGEAPEIDPFVVAYAECALWSSSDGEIESLKDDHSVDDIAPDTMAKMIADCKAFREQAGALLDGITDEQAGHDFWLTRCGHGAGFWDRGLGAVGDKLTKLCKVFGNVDLYVGDDGKIYQ